MTIHMLEDLIPSKRPPKNCFSAQPYKGQIEKTSRHAPQLSSRCEAGDIVRVGFSEVFALQDALTHLADLLRLGWVD